MAPVTKTDKIPESWERQLARKASQKPFDGGQYRHRQSVISSNHSTIQPVSARHNYCLPPMNLVRGNDCEALWSFRNLKSIQVKKKTATKTTKNNPKKPHKKPNQTHNFPFSLQKRKLKIFTQFLKGVWMDASFGADVLKLMHND